MTDRRGFLAALLAVPLAPLAVKAAEPRPTISCPCGREVLDYGDPIHCLCGQVYTHVPR